MINWENMEEFEEEDFKDITNELIEDLLKSNLSFYGGKVIKLKSSFAPGAIYCISTTDSIGEDFLCALDSSFFDYFIGKGFY